MGDALHSSVMWRAILLREHRFEMEQIRGLQELRRVVLEAGRCAACGACTGGCPYLTAFRGKTVALDQCTVDQGRCFAYCPMTFFEPGEASRLAFDAPYQEDAPIGYFRQANASRATDAAVASSGLGGGTVTALMSNALQEGTIDCAVLTGVPLGERYPRGMVATSLSEIEACAGSRYVGAHSLSALREALDRGFQRIGVVGVPCQVKSLRKMALYDLKHESLRERIPLVVGLFCNWAFASREFLSFLAQEIELKGTEKLHIPPPPANVLEVETEEGTRQIGLDRLRPLIQAACSECTDMTSEFADISVGMYEGRPGWNTLITRSDTGAQLVARSVEKGNLEVGEFPAANLDHLMQASANKKRRAHEKAERV